MKEPTPRPGDRGDGRIQGDDDLQMDRSIVPNPVTTQLDLNRGAFDRAKAIGDLNAIKLIVITDRALTPALQAYDWEAVR